ncbi:pyruvate kinase [Flavobacteriales bacterium]|nr:pyruvate kinase [Flavobacteriales bacterium]|tara:strand:+ start:705 stop:2123 length:1419 start_codon:yes stop_codon:yes gene_type:complete
MRKTKIIATIGPATESKVNLEKIIKAGVNVCRLNFSHGSHEDHLKVIKNIAEINKEQGIHIATLGDLQGPKLRVGKMEENTLLVDGNEITFTSEDCLGNAERVYMNYKNFAKDVKAGEFIRLDDGKLEMQILETNGKDTVKAKITQGGVLKSNKGVNLPNTVISLPSLTEKDLADLDFALEHNLDWIGLSFVRSARDIIELKGIISANNKKAKVIAKVEKPEAVENIDEIIKEADAIMVARGDLGVEIPMEKVPIVQKMIVEKCIKYSKPVVIATQMMESMIESSTPTRAEVNDVANAVLDGADAVMLSGETSVGKFPIYVIEAMVKILQETGDFRLTETSEEKNPERSPDRFITDSICFNASNLADKTEAKAIVTMTFSGYTAFKISSKRPKAHIFVFSGNRELLTKLSLVWGVQTFYYDKMVSTDHTIADIHYMLKKEGYVKEGDLIINTASIPLEESGKTNMLKLSYID